MSTINGRLLNIPNVNDFKKHLDTLDDKTAALTEKDSDLQAQIDKIEDRTNLVDIVATYAELEDYDTTILSADDIIEVLHDETQNEATTYYRWVILASGEKRWELIGLVGPYVSLHAEETIDAHKTFTVGITTNVIDGLSTPTTNDQATNKQYVDNFFVDKATEQIVTGVKHFKADNTALENLGVYSNETILEKATKIKVGGSDAFNIDAEADYTNFWKLTSFLGTTKIAVNDTQAVNFIAYEADSFLEKPTTFKINGNSVLKTSAEGGGKAIFDKPADFHSLVYVGGHEIRFPDYVDFTDNTAQHNKVATIANDYTNFYKTSTFKSNVNVDGLMFAGGHEIRFPEYVEFKDNTAAHNTVLRVDQNFIDANKVITAKQGLNIDVTPTQAQHAVRKDYVDSALSSKADLVNGLVPASQLPSYVDDVLESSDAAHFPAEGEQGKIYVALDTGFTYRWSGSEYVQIGGQDLSNFVTLDSDQTISGVKTFSSNINLSSTYGSGTTYSIESDDDFGQLRIAHDTTRLLTINDNGIMPNGTRSLGNQSYHWQDLYLSGDINLSNTGPHNIKFGDTAYAQISSSAIYVNRKLSTGIVEPQTSHNSAYTVGSSIKVWDTVYTDKISDGTNTVTAGELYNSIWNSQNTVTASNKLKVSSFNTIDSNTDISVNNEYTGYEELKGLFTNTSTTNSIVVTFLQGLKAFLCNDDNVTFNGTDQITIPANTSIEFSIVNGCMCAVNFGA